MSKTMKEISAEWKELRPLIGNLIGHLTSKEAQLVSMERAYEKGYANGFDDGQDNTATSEYQRGLNDAWKAARKISREYSFSDMNDLFDVANWTDIYDFQPDVVIGKLKDYEQKKAEEEAEIKVGDVLQHKRDHNTKIAVTGIHDSGMISGICVGKSCVNQLGASFTNRNPTYWEKTGHHFPQVAEILKALEESDG